MSLQSTDTLTLLSHRYRFSRFHQWLHRLQLVSLFVVRLCTSVAVVLGFTLVLWCDQPIVVVLSGSMEPGFSRFDLMFSTQRSKTPKALDVVVFQNWGETTGIVHRVHAVHHLGVEITEEIQKKELAEMMTSMEKKRRSQDSEPLEKKPFRLDPMDVSSSSVQQQAVRLLSVDPQLWFRTKGDANVRDDVGLYSIGRQFMKQSDIVGYQAAHVPWMGQISVILAENPLLKIVFVLFCLLYYYYCPG